MIWVRLEWDAEQAALYPANEVSSKTWGSAAQTACPVTEHDWSVSDMRTVANESPAMQQTTNRGAA